ncbi:hypothetical protein [Medusavirus stheno T3]|uniref:Uncharacterized protein n=1 Tax=Medusavirus stheno T3 TaxID=3069717 RepID=A0A7S7YEK0_9VIRU|nr:hypothetical protein QKU73_gp134 [Acanthamoeba castellanii medusavirus]QPB44315.1 hypothetical protein [Medusavirus stheno T3]
MEGKRSERQRTEGRVCTGHVMPEYYAREPPPAHPTQAKYHHAGVWMCGECYNANKSYTRVWKSDRRCNDKRKRALHRANKSIDL